MSEHNEIFKEMILQLEENEEARNNTFPPVNNLSEYGATKSILLNVVFCGGGPSASYILEVQEGNLVDAWLSFQDWSNKQTKQLSEKHLDMLREEFQFEIETASEGL